MGPFFKRSGEWLRDQVAPWLPVGLGFKVRWFLLYWLVPNFGGILASGIVTFLSAGSSPVTEKYFGIREGVSTVGLAFLDQWQSWQILICAHFVLSVSIAAWAWRHVRSRAEDGPQFGRRVIVILVLSAGAAALLARFVPVHNVIYPEAYKKVMSAHVLLVGLDALTASRVELWVVFSMKLLAGNFAIFVIIVAIVPGQHDDVRSLRRRYHTLRLLTYLTSAMFVVATVIVFLWASFPGWQMDWARAQELQGPPPGKAGKAVSAPSARFAPEDPTWQRQFEFERARYAARASGFVTCYAIIYTMLILFYYLVPKGMLDTRARALWEYRATSEKGMSFSNWQELHFGASWFERVKAGIALVAPLLASPVADIASSALK